MAALKRSSLLLSTSGAGRDAETGRRVRAGCCLPQLDKRPIGPRDEAPRNKRPIGPPEAVPEGERNVRPRHGLRGLHGLHRLHGIYP
eukprot:6324309-Pyramimonas_sp.AAC.1